MSEWRDIETAPKDERVLISVRFGDGERETYLAFWSELDDGFRPEYAEMSVFDADSITHWMPLPKPPGEA